MMKFISVLLITVFLSVGSFAQELTPQATVSVLTVAPGHEELFAAFGHSAIRIQDPELNLDRVYNYGTYYYNQPYFYLNFARGYLKYGLSVSTYDRFQGYYAYYNRQVVAQQINLNAAQAQDVFDFLENNARPENSMYYYDYFYDNCATRIRDVFSQALGVDFRIPDEYVKAPGKTVRELTDHYIEEEFPWGKLGIDLCLGLPMDKVMTDYEYMYLPDYIYEGFDVAQIKNDSVWNKSVKGEKVILASRPMDYPMPWFTPTVAFSLLFVFGILLFVIQLKSSWIFRGFDFILFFGIGVVGLLLSLLWGVTDHAAAANNLNILWAIPMHLIVAFALLRKQPKRWVNWYLALYIPFSILLVLFWKVIPQDLNEGFIPIVFLMVVRSLAIILRK